MIDPGTVRKGVTQTAGLRAFWNRYYFSSAALVLLGLTVWGFHAFYLEGKGAGGRTITDEIRGWVILHGITMTAWVLLFVVQPFLIAGKKFSAHRTLGRVGTILAAAVCRMRLPGGIPPHNSWLSRCSASWSLPFLWQSESATAGGLKSMLQ